VEAFSTWLGTNKIQAAAAAAAAVGALLIVKGLTALYVGEQRDYPCYCAQPHVFSEAAS
jgi:hypothetical protein